MIRSVILVLFLIVTCKTCFAIDKQMLYNLKQHSREPRSKKEQVYYKNLSGYIAYACQVYKLPKRLYMAILARESQYQVGAVGLTGGEPTDFGIGQVHHRTAKAYGFGKKRLLTNSVYSIRASAKVLRDFKNMYRSREKRWYLRYNTSNKKKQKEYYEAISRYF